MRFIALLVIPIAVISGCGTPSHEESPATVGGSSPASVANAVHGVVRGPDTKPVANVMVNAISLDEPTKAVPELAVITDDLGRYEWPLSPGRYRLTATAPGVGIGSTEVVVTRGEGAVADLNLAP